MFRTSLWTITFFLLTSAFALANSVWTEDFEAAKKEAARTGKPILVDVTGSDWCPPCQRMEAEVFTQPAFLQTAPSRYVLLRLDFPRTIKQAEKIQAQNQRLAERYPFDGFPTYFLMDQTGGLYAAYTGYLPGGTKAFFQLLSGMEKQKEQLASLQKAAAAAAPGNDKAQKLHALFQQVDAWGIASQFTGLPAKIIQEDKTNQAGLKLRYQLYAEYTYLLNTWTEKSDYKKAATDTATLAQRAQAYPDLQQKILFTQGMIYLNALSDEAQAKRVFQQVVRLDKTTLAGQQAATYLDRLP